MSLYNYLSDEKKKEIDSIKGPVKRVCEIFEEIEKNSKRSVKIELLESMNNDELRETAKFFLETAYNPYLIYSVSDFNDKKIYTHKVPTLEQLIELRQKLNNRLITGNIAKDEIRNLLLCHDEIVSKWLIRAFQKDLKAGIGQITINKAFTNLIPDFPIGLCETFDYTRNETKELPAGTRIMERKFDGLRCLVFIDENGKCKFVSRNNKPVYNTEHIEKEITCIQLKNLVLDAELMGNDWNDSLSIAMSEYDREDKTNLKLYIFDMLTIDEWNSKTSIGLLERKQRIKDIIKPIEYLKYTDYINLSDKDFTFAEEIFTKWLYSGYEGAVLKLIGSSYPFGRSTNWLKWKEFYTTEVVITGFEPGKIDTRNENRLGAFICDYKGVSVNISGFSDVQRDQFWENRNSMIGLTIEVKYKAVTKDGSLLFPKFLRIRKDMN